MLSACAALLATGLAACAPDPADAPPIGAAEVDAASPADTAVMAVRDRVIPGRADGIDTGAAAEVGLIDASDVYARAQVEFRLAHHDARERLLAALEVCDGKQDPEPCAARALRAYDAEVADIGRRTGLRADEIVPLDFAGGVGDGLPVVLAGGNRG
ncbi:hypothetical protein P873_07910 [Arenimonas composti TR7-09 = DSM 18010]|uniref:DUF4398 domain-containing protein n=1 Tax=Arenimonas composti TR7-09 = DSM 18010 TaxID=1121013 RepID=A0A091BBW0_9GAMM|nr:hypothetical protein P873_07910 [Arenimonas composti TR7-09 = DSM 18010]